MQRSNSRDLSEYALKLGKHSQQLRDAASEGRLSDVAAMVSKYGADYDVMNNVDRRVTSRDFNKTPLICAIHAGQVDVVKALLNASAIDTAMHPPRFFYRPLAEAAIKNQPEILRILAALPSANVNTFDWNDNSVLTLTLLHCPSALHALLDVPTLNVNATDTQKRTTLHIVASLSAHLMTPALISGVAMLINHKDINLNARAQAGWTPLMLAAREGNAELVELLLKAGADDTLKNKSHATALDIARRSSRHSVVEQLEQSHRPAFRR